MIQDTNDGWNTWREPERPSTNQCDVPVRYAAPIPRRQPWDPPWHLHWSWTLAPQHRIASGAVGWKILEDGLKENQQSNSAEWSLSHLNTGFCSETTDNAHRVTGEVNKANLNKNWIKQFSNTHNNCRLHVEHGLCYAHALSYSHC